MLEGVIGRTLKGKYHTDAQVIRHRGQYSRGPRVQEIGLCLASAVFRAAGEGASQSVADIADQDYGAYRAIIDGNAVLRGRMKAAPDNKAASPKSLLQVTHEHGRNCSRRPEGRQAFAVTVRAALNKSTN